VTEPLTKEQIRKWGEALGFERVGFAAAAEPPNSRERLLAWLDRGHHASMAWMARDPIRRVDPEQILEGARSVIAVALVYYLPETVSSAAGLPKISRYARGDDYHEVIGAKLRRLAEQIREAAPDAGVRIACDTSPILEKAFSESAGLGWIGKNTCLIHPRLGSWFFLGEIFTTIPFPPDPRVTDLCGTCTRCLEACPTGAFPEPYVLDSNRCISYRNIEHRGPHPEPWRTEMGEWLVGCDICQEVCPWNRKAPTSREERFAPRLELTGTRAEEWEAMDDADYRRRVKGTAITRIKPADMRRNAALVRENRARASRESAAVQDGRADSSHEQARNACREDDE
jgi:epoxyqueuosine reductase